METFFDSPERSSNEVVLEEILRLKKNELISQLLEGYPEPIIILNAQRQIVAFNSRALKTFNAESYLDILGKRPGEALNCIHKDEMEGGCGTSKFCAECGAANSIKKTKDTNQPSEEECRVTVQIDNKEHSLDFFVRTQPIIIDNSTYTSFAIKDISNEKRREALEKIFFHDVLNTAGAVSGLAQILPESESEQERETITQSLISSSKILIDEIITQRDIRSAEDGNLAPHFSPVWANKILTSVFELYKSHPLSEHKILKMNSLAPDLNFITDATFVIRSLGNLVKNALEASDPGQEVILNATENESHISFSVFNQNVIPTSVQLQLFNRSFSTKQKKGRGIGLYSVKLIVEQYLHGNVSFVSDQNEGTIFTIRLHKKS